MKGGALYCGKAAFEPIAGAHFILPLYPGFSPFEEAEHRSPVPSSDPIRLLISPAFISRLPLKHCDNAEVDKAPCTASSASTSLQTESIQDNGKLECLIS